MAVNHFEFIVNPDEAKQRLDIFLAGQTMISLPRARIKKLIAGGFITTNGKNLKPHYLLKAGDQINATWPEPVALNAAPENIPLEIVFEDQDIIVVNKPRGLVVHPAAGNFTGTLVNALLYHCQDLSGIGGAVRPGIVHRLDKDTSGLIVVAKNDAAHQSLTSQFKNKQVLKQYLALVHGPIKQAEGKIETPIGRHPTHRKKMAVVRGWGSSKKGREALTLFKVVKRFKEYTLLELTPKTGRTHQIRVHLNSIDHAVVGDPLYGHRREKFKVAGQLLHSFRLGFVHPGTGQYVEFEQAMPREMEQVISKLSKM